ncbi:hypothetical protein [Capnocytophaga sp.]|uniref:hypothetical protein n=1 Tax=Capnocytophaga sp. TaxID=44737 RepID=UPI0026DBE283|nr:hypothetical protein [Capnocytophaga sp.]MDO5104901.1 hypothetical protein [Capnocytophaga sp.]
MKNNKNLWIYGIISFTILFLGSAILFQIFNVNDLPSQFYGALIGVVITAIITVFLLQGQTANEEKRERNLKVFEKKQDVYHAFLEKLKEIIMDGEIKIAQYGENTDMKENIDELKELLFELGYIQMHTSEENTKQIFAQVSEIMKVLSDFSNEGNRKQQELPHFYGKLSQHLFAIVSILKNDLYGIQTQTIDDKTVATLLEECGLYIEQEEVNKFELQNYFWNRLQDEFLQRGYEFQKRDLTQDVYEFYVPKARNRYRFFGIDVPIYTTQDNRTIYLSVEIENKYYYGIRRNSQNEQNEEMQQTVSEVVGLTKSPWWFGWRYPTEQHDLDFYTFQSKAFERLKNPRKRETFVRNIVDEMEIYIKKFQEIATKNNL